MTSPSDRQLGNAITAALGRESCGFARTWEDVIAAVKSARHVFTVDGGMVHVASYYGVPVDAVFTAGRDRKWLPWSVGSRIIKRTGLDCQPCTIFGLVPECPWQYRCKDAEHWQILECDDLFPG